MAITQTALSPNENFKDLSVATHTHTSEDFTENEPQRGASHQNVSDTERIISGVGGGALAVYGLTRGDWLGVGLTALGAVLVERGVRGY